MNRRTFFNFLGSATLGTIIALNLPDTIAPIKLWVEKPKITFAALMDAYRSCCQGNIEPNLIVLSLNDYKDAKQLIPENCTFQYSTFELPLMEEIKFMNAKLVSSDVGLHGHFVRTLGFGKVEDGNIEVYGKTFGTCGRFEFI